MCRCSVSEPTCTSRDSDLLCVWILHPVSGIAMQDPRWPLCAMAKMAPQPSGRASGHVPMRSAPCTDGGGAPTTPRPALGIRSVPRTPRPADGARPRCTCRTPSAPPRGRAKECGEHLTVPTDVAPNAFGLAARSARSVPSTRATTDSTCTTSDGRGPQGATGGCDDDAALWERKSTGA